MKTAATLFLMTVMAMKHGVTQTPVHVDNEFQFTLRAPLRTAAPLFGPEGERCWAGEGWDPRFLFPQPGKDVQGAVFTVQRSAHNSVWVNTVFDLEAGRMQYVSFVDGVVVSTIDVKLSPVDAANTMVAVRYARTALNASYNDHVRELGEKDRASGPEWQQQIEGCLAAPVKR